MHKSGSIRHGMSRNELWALECTREKPKASQASLVAQGKPKSTSAHVPITTSVSPLGWAQALDIVGAPKGQFRAVSGNWWEWSPDRQFQAIGDTAPLEAASRPAASSQTHLLFRENWIACVTLFSAAIRCQ